MNIGFDAKRLFNNTTGLGNYSRTLVRNIQLFSPEHSYHLYTDRITKNKDTEYFFDQNKFIIHVGPKYFKSLWRSKFIVNDLIRDQIDVFHGLSNELPYGIHKTNIKSLVTIHDLIFKAYPSQYKWLDTKTYHLKSKYAVNNANHVIAISQATKSEIINYYDIDPNQIDVIYQSCGQEYKQYNKTKLILNTKQEIPKRYYLYIGSIIERKGLLQIVKAIQLMNPKNRVNLAIVGNGPTYLQKVKNYIQSNQLEQWFFFLKKIDNNDLAYLYANAEAMIYPSIMEGFGIPIIEAGLMSTPVISSNISSLPEAGGPDILQIDPTDPNEIKNAIQQIEQGLYPVERCQKVKSYINKQFDSKKLSKQLIELYQNK